MADLPSPSPEQEPVAPGTPSPTAEQPAPQPTPASEPVTAEVNDTPQPTSAEEPVASEQKTEAPKPKAKKASTKPPAKPEPVAPETPSPTAEQSTPQPTPAPEPLTSQPKEVPQPVAETPPAKSPAEKKAPPIEAKPLPTFIEEHFFPSLTQALAAINITNVSLLWVPELNQVRGSWAEGKHEFVITFAQGDLKGLKTFAYSSYGAPPSTLESFMIDERKITLELLVFYTIQRLTAQKVLVLN